jgi:hypothetical protein
LATLLAQQAQTVPVILVKSTILAARLATTGKAAAGVVSVQAVSLVEGVLKAMFVTKLKAITAVVIAATVVATGAGVVSYRVMAADPTADSGQPGPLRPRQQPPANADETGKQPSEMPVGEWRTRVQSLSRVAESLKGENDRLKRQLELLQKEVGRLNGKVDQLVSLYEGQHPSRPTAKRPVGDEEERRAIDVASERDGVLVAVGTEIKEGEKIAPDQILTVRVGSELKEYRRLRIGDTVEEGQLLARIDDRLARDELNIKRAKLAAAQADLAAAEKTCAETKLRYETQLRLQANRTTSEEEVRSAKYTLEKCLFDSASKKEAVAVARFEVSQAQTLLEMHQIRSRTRGFIKAIRKYPGESVKALEPVFGIQPSRD